MALALTVPLFVAAAHASEPGTFDRTLNVSGPVTIDVRSDPGGVYITTGSSAHVIIHAIVKPRYGRLDLGIAEANILALIRNPPVEQTGNRIRIGYPADASILRAVTIRYEIETPQATQLQATTESGGIRVDGIAGPATTSTASGRTELSNIQSDLDVTSQSGAISIRNTGGNVLVRNESGGVDLTAIRGSVDATTTSGRTQVSDVTGNVRSSVRSGSIRIDNARGAVDAHNTSGSIDAHQLGGSVKAETTSGAIRISQLTPAPIRALTGSGAIRVELATGGGYLLDALSSSGKVSGKALGAFPRPRDQHSLKVQIGTGGPLVDLDTRSSKIEID